MSDMQSGGGPAGALPFIYGHVDPAFFPVEQLQRAAVEALDRYSQSALNYGASIGCGPLREYLRAKFARDEGLKLDENQLMITGSASGGLDTAVRLFTWPGDTVLVEAPSYHEALAIIRDYPVKLAAVPLDENGLQVEALAERLRQLAQDGERPTLLYTIPTFQNPSGVTLSAVRRLSVLELACEYRLLVVEDDVYRDLYFEQPPPPSLFAMDVEGCEVIRLGSFSKILAPGLRLGWAMGPAGRIQSMVNSGLTTSGGGANPFGAYATAVFCQHGWLEAHIEQLRQNYQERREVLLQALKTHMPANVTWTRPGGGFFVWLTLPEPLTAEQLLHRAHREQITFLTGEPFFAEGGGERHLRLPFSFIQRPELARGVQVLGQLISDSLAQT